MLYLVALLFSGKRKRGKGLGRGEVVGGRSWEGNLFKGLIYEIKTEWKKERMEEERRK